MELRAGPHIYRQGWDLDVFDVGLSVVQSLLRDKLANETSKPKQVASHMMK